jgi:hypothetical protein
VTTGQSVASGYMLKQPFAVVSERSNALWRHEISRVDPIFGHYALFLSRQGFGNI